MAQPSLSCSIKTLEKELNKELIIRGSKKFQLTEEGSKLYETLKSVFYILEHDVNYFAKNNEFEELNIGISHYLSDFLLTEVIKQFNKKYPHVHLNISLYSKLNVNKYEEELDILIDYKDYTNLLMSDNKIKLVDLENIIVCGPELYDELGEVSTINDLDGMKMISLRPSKKKGKFQKWCYDHNVSFIETITINESQFGKDMIKSNLGVCLVNKKFIEEELLLGDIKQIPIKENIFNDEVEIVCKNNSNTKNIENFVDLLLKNYC